MIKNKQTEIASKLHDIWSNWYKHQRDNSTPENIARWEKQSNLPFEKLSDEDKEKDLILAGEIMDVIFKTEWGL
jgi:hypothetical protein